MFEIYSPLVLSTIVSTASTTVSTASLSLARRMLSLIILSVINGRTESWVTIISSSVKGLYSLILLMMFSIVVFLSTPPGVIMILSANAETYCSTKSSAWDTQSSWTPTTIFSISGSNKNFSIVWISIGFLPNSRNHFSV